MSNIDALFEGMDKAPVVGRSRFMVEGDYKVKIKSIKVQASTKKRGETYFVCEFDIVEAMRTAQPDVYKPGLRAGWLPKFSQASTFGNIKELMFAILGMRGADVPDGDPAHALATALARAAAGSEAGVKDLEAIQKKLNPTGTPSTWQDFVLGPDGEGTEVLLNCQQTKTQTGGDFTRHNWYPLPAAA